jgi:hypothetical protein
MKFHNEKQIKEQKQDYEKYTNPLQSDERQNQKLEIDNRLKEILKEELHALQEKNAAPHKAFCGFGKFINKGAIENNRLKIDNLEDQIYGTEINSREKREIAQQKTLPNVLAKNSTQNNPTNQR